MIERAAILSSDGAPLDVFVLFSDTGLPEVSGVAIDEDSRPGLTTSGLEQTVKDAVANNQLSLDDFEATIMRTAVEQTKGNLSAAAKLIGLTRRQLDYRLKAAARERENT